MQEHPQVQRCRDGIARLALAQAWNLDTVQQTRYAQRLVCLYPEIGRLDGARLETIIRYYHSEHAQVEALIDVEHPDHGERWEEWRQHALRILRARLSGWFSRDEAVQNLDDLAQEALLDLWRGLNGFRYTSRFSTWAFTVISNSLVRRYRAIQAHKRTAELQAQSLEALVTADDLIADQAATLPEQEALNALLGELVRRVLSQCPDQRLATIFEMWTDGDQTVRMIGERLDLSAGRVHALLRQAAALLRDEVLREEWVEPGWLELPRPTARRAQPVAAGYD